MTAIFLRIISPCELEIDMQGKHGLGRVKMSLYGVICPSLTSKDPLERKIACMVMQCLENWLSDFGIVSGDEITVSLVGESGFTGIVFSSPYSNASLNYVMARHGVCKFADTSAHTSLKWSTSDTLTFISHYTKPSSGSP